jgi:RimJ/RimL family protein N-acetyltransferase
MGDEASRFVGGPISRQLAWRGFMSVAGAWALTGFGMFSVVDKVTGGWIGRVGPWRPEGWPGAEVGWGIVPQAQGKGFASEAATASIDWAVDTLGWTDVIHCIDPLNAPSQAVARKLGSRILRQGRMPAPFDDKDIDIWGQSATEWRARPR